MASGLETLGEPYYNVEETSNSPLTISEEEYSGYIGYDGNNSTFNNTFEPEGPLKRPLEVIIPIATVMSILSLMTSIGNALVIVAVRTDRRLRTVSNYFILSLAFADLLIGILVMPLSIIYFVEGKWLLGLIVCQSWLTTDYVTCTASIFSLFILSLDRYWSISSPLKYMKKRTPRRAALMIGMAWCLSFLWIIPVWGWHYFEHGGERRVAPNECDTEFYTNIVFKVVTAIINFYIPLMFMLFVYGKIFMEIKARSKMCVGQKSRGKKRYSAQTSNMVSLPVAVDVCTAPPSNESKEGEVHNRSWVPDFDSLSTSKSSTQEVPDQSESCPNQIMMKRIRKGEVDKQLKNISHLTLATMGLAGIVGPGIAGGNNVSKGRGIMLKRKKHEDKPLAIKQVKRIIPEEKRANQTVPVIPTIREPSNNYDSGENCETNEEGDKIQKTEINGNVSSDKSKSTSCQNESHLCPDRPANGSTKRRISFTVDSSASKEELEPLRRNSYDDRRTGSIRFKGVKYTKDSSSPTHLLPEDHCSPEHLQFDRTRQKSENGGGKSSFSRFSIRHGKTSEFLKDRIRRFSLNKERKAAKQLGIIVSCFITCWLPYFISFLVIAYCPHCVHPDVHYALIWLGYINSTMNPFIYPLCNSNFRKAFKKIFGFTSCKRQPKSRPQNRTLYRRPRHARAKY